MNKLMMSKSSSQIVSPKTPSKEATPKTSPLKKPTDNNAFVRKSPQKKAVDPNIGDNARSNGDNAPVLRKEACGACVKCLLPDCGACAQCAGGGAPGLQKLCVKKVCRNKVWTKN